MRVWLAEEMAYYYAAAGEIDKAFQLLGKAIQYNSSNKQHILARIVLTACGRSALREACWRP